MLCVQLLFWYIAHKENYGILATPARTIVKTRLNSGDTLRTLVLRFQIDNFWMADGVGEGVN